MCCVVENDVSVEFEVFASSFQQERHIMKEKRRMPNELPFLYFCIKNITLQVEHNHKTSIQMVICLKPIHLLTHKRIHLVNLHPALHH